MDSSRDKSEVEDNVFEYLTEPVECVQDYVPGGLHPVYLGDRIGDGRYKILRKLGYGGYSTVWLAQDNSENGVLVALKVVRADGDCAEEIQFYDILRANAGQHPGSSCIMMLKDQFSIQGPNGNHDCLAYEVLGPSIARVLENSIGLNTTAYLTLSCARKIIYQVLLGLDYMHSVGLVHGDIYAANVLFTVKDLSQEPMDILCQPYDQVSVGVKRISGSQQPGDPRHLTLNRPLNRFLSTEGNVKLSDLGNSFLKDNPPNKLETPLETRSPETIFDNDISVAQDSWAFGCFVYNVLTNRYPFDLAFVYDKDSRDDSHLIQLFSLLGPLPAKIKHSWPRYRVYFDEEGQLKNFGVDDDVFSYTGLENLPEDDCHSTTSDTMNNGLQQEADEAVSIARPGHPEPAQERFDPGLYPSIVKVCERKIRKDQEDPESVADYTALNPPLRERWLDEKHPDMQLEESELVLDLLQGLLTYEPGQRLSTKGLLQHPWIRTYCAPGGELSKSTENPALVPRNKRKRSTEDEYSQLDGKRKT